MIGRQHFCAGARFFVPLVQLPGDGRQFVNHMARDRHPQGDLFGGAAVADFQIERVVELALFLFRDACEVHLDEGKRFKEARVVPSGL
ncbi:hypothetical protein DF268_45495 [Streptomyces sp. V2]|nr:hypothetical protein DF268_45495 [Streptomyces sp. V2]